MDKLNFFETKSIKIVESDKDSETEADDSNELVFKCIKKTIESMAEHTNKHHSNVVWKCFYVIQL